MGNVLKGKLDDIAEGDSVIIQLPQGAMQAAVVIAVRDRYIEAGGVKFSRATARERGVKGMHAREVYAPLEVVYASTGATALEMLNSQRNAAMQKRQAIIDFLRDLDFSSVKTQVLLNAAKTLGYQPEGE